MLVLVLIPIQGVGNHAEAIAGMGALGEGFAGAAARILHPTLLQPKALVDSKTL